MRWHCERKVVGNPRIASLGRKLRSTSTDEISSFINDLKSETPLRILKVFSESSEESMGAFAFPAKTRTKEEKEFIQAGSCFVGDLRMRRVSGFHCKRVDGMEGQFLAKPVFGVSLVHSGALFQKFQTMNWLKQHGNW